MKVVGDDGHVLARRSGLASSAGAVSRGDRQTTLVLRQHPSQVVLFAVFSEARNDDVRREDAQQDGQHKQEDDNAYLARL